MPKFQAKWLGTIPYSIGLELQQELVETSIQKQKSYIIGLEHPKVVTLGRRASFEADIKVSPEDLDSLNYQYYRVERGGHATLHNPGQLVVYPILSLEKHGLTVRDYVCLLQKTTQKLLQEVGIESEWRDQNPGLYTSKGKIAFFGIRIKKGTTYHGLSLNVSNELEDFFVIKSCGKDSEIFDKVSLYDPNASCQNLFEKWCELFNKIL